MNSRPLAGKRILLTRASHQLAPLQRKVEAAGAEAVQLPCLQVEPIEQAISSGLSAVNRFSDLLFTSSNGVAAVADYCKGHHLDLPGLLAGKRIAAVGEQTADALTDLGIAVAIKPEVASQDGLINAYKANGLPSSLLFFRAEEGRDCLETFLTQQQIETCTVKAYRTICPAHDAAETIAMLEADQIDAVLLGSAKTAQYYLQRVGSTALANRPILVGISTAMAGASKKLGLNVQVVAKSASFDAMLDALAGHFDAAA